MTSRLDARTKQELNELLGELGPDTQLLLLSNILVIILALVQHWSIGPLLWVFWWQNIIIGFFNWRRMTQLKEFSADGLKINGRRVLANEKTKKWMAQFFLLHYNAFHLFYLFFLLSRPGEIQLEVVLSVSIGITIFSLNHFFSYRHNLEKDLSEKPNITAISFFPYARVIPMHLVIFIGSQFGMESRIALFAFLVLKTLADLIMHIFQHISFNNPEDQKTSKQGKDSTKQRKTLKERLKLWFFLAWIAFLLFVIILVVILKELNT